MQSEYRPQPRAFFDEHPYGAHSSHVSEYTLSTPAYPAYDTASSYLVTSSNVGLTESSSNYSYRSVTPLHGRHSSSHSRYYGSEGMVSHRSSLGSIFGPTAKRQYSSSDLRGSSSPTFIPTPSDMANSYNNYQPMVPRSPTVSPSERYSTTLPYPSPHPYHGGPVRPRVSTSRPRSGTLGSSGSHNSASGERFPCEKCGKTFSRSHDRKRHHETQHLATPIIHRCRYCEKEFSRADSLKRHIDNGCDEAPQHQRQQ